MSRVSLEIISCNNCYCYCHYYYFYYYYYYITYFLLHPLSHILAQPSREMHQLTVLKMLFSRYKKVPRCIWNVKPTTYVVKIVTFVLLLLIVFTWGSIPVVFP